MKLVALSCENLTKRYGPVEVVRQLNLTVQQGEILALLGASGCGKTTTLRLIAGFERPDGGSITIGDQQISGPQGFTPPEQRHMGIVFQQYALFPHLNVADNIAYGLHRQPRAHQDIRVGEALDLVGLGELKSRMPHELSGGQQQRVALARALAPKPTVLLLDEPFSNLDAALRRTVRDEVRRILHASDTTTIFVTHDQEEALSVADRIAVMSAGQAVQVGTPLEVYTYPATREVAAFLGDANFLPGEASGNSVTCALGVLPLHKPTNGAVTVMIRPEQIRLYPDPAGRGRVEAVTYFGHDQLVGVTVDGLLPLQSRAWPQPELCLDAAVRLIVQGSVVAYPA